MMTVGTGGFSGSAAATGPVAGLDPVLDFRKKMARAIKDHPYAQDYKSKRKKAQKVKEAMDHEVSMAQSQLSSAEKDIKTLKRKLGKKEKNIPAWVQAKITDTAHNTDAAASYTKEETDRHNHQVAHLYQYKVKIPTVGETIIFGNSEAELRMKLRLLVNPRYQGQIDVERIFPSEAGKFFNNKRLKAYKNLPEAMDPKKETAAASDAAAAQADMAKKQDAMKKQAAAQATNAKIAIEKKKIELKKQEMQKALQMKVAALKKNAAAGSQPVATEEYIPESSGGNIDAIKKIADSNTPGSIQFLNGEKFQLQPAIAQKIFQAYESLGMQKNKAKFSNAANETTQSFQKILNFVGAAG